MFQEEMDDMDSFLFRLEAHVQAFKWSREIWPLQLAMSIQVSQVVDDVTSSFHPPTPVLLCSPPHRLKLGPTPSFRRNSLISCQSLVSPSHSAFNLDLWLSLAPTLESKSQRSPFQSHSAQHRHTTRLHRFSIPVLPFHQPLCFSSLDD